MVLVSDAFWPADLCLAVSFAAKICQEIPVFYVDSIAQQNIELKNSVTSKSYRDWG